MSIQNIVNVQITRQTSVPTRPGFGTGAFVAQNATFQNRTKVYSSLTEVTSDIYAGADLKAAAAAYFGQQVSPTKLTAIKAKANVNQVDVIVWDADFVASNSILVTLDGVGLTPVVFTSDQATTIAAVAAEIQGAADVTTATVTDTREITVTYADTDSHEISATVTLGASQADETVTTTTYPDTTGTLVEALAEAVSENNDWYALAIYSRALADIEAVSDYIQGLGSNNPKLFFAQDGASEILDVADSTDIASVLQAKANFRTSVWYHSDDAEYLEMALMGGNLPQPAGSITWAYKTLSGITVDVLTDGEKSAAHGKACNTYTTEASVNITEEGKVSDSPFEWIDVIRGVDWIQTNMTLDIYALLVNLPKIPYDSQGIGLIKGTIQNRLQRAVEQGILLADPAPSVSAPALADVPAADRGNRVLNGVTFTGVLAGAIQKVNVAGTVTL